MHISMQISITAGIPENKMQRKHSENTKNPEMTEEWWDRDSGQFGLRSDKHRDVTGEHEWPDNW